MQNPYFPGAAFAIKAFPEAQVRHERVSFVQVSQLRSQPPVAKQVFGEDKSRSNPLL